MCLRLPRDLVPKIELIKTTLERNPRVLSTAAASTVPGKRGALFALEDWEGRDSDDRIEMGLVSVDPGFLSTFKLEMAEGRFFSDDFPTDKEGALVVNEAAVRAMGMRSSCDRLRSCGGTRLTLSEASLTSSPRPEPTVLRMLATSGCCNKMSSACSILSTM